MKIVQKFVKSKLSFVVALLLFSGLKIGAVPIKFAIIGDYGEMGEDGSSPHPSSVAVAALVKSWDPDFVITTGDNNYPKGGYETIDINVGSLYSTYIYPYTGRYEPPTIMENRFFPCLGNHDFDTEGAAPYLTYFTMPELGNKYYYDFVRGDVHFFALCSDERGPDIPAQLTWLEEKVRSSESAWKIVYFHHPVYSSKIMVPPRERNNIYTKNRERRIEAPFAEWGVSAVLNAHIHVYERFMIGGIPYITNGLGGGKVIYEFCDEAPDAESVRRFTGEHGAMQVEATDKELSLRFITISGEIADEITMTK